MKQYQDMFDFLAKAAFDAGHTPQTLPPGMKIVPVTPPKDREPIGLRFIEKYRVK